MNRRTLFAGLSVAAAFALPAASQGATQPTFSLEISNETGGSFQTSIKALGDEYDVATPVRVTTKTTLPVSALVLVLFESGKGGAQQRAFSLTLPADAGPKLVVKLVTRSEAKGVYIASATGATTEEINVLTYLNS